MSLLGRDCVLLADAAAAVSASAFSAPTASTILSLVRLPPKALGMKALTLGGKRERMDVNRPGSEEAGGSGAADAAGAAGRAPTLELDLKAWMPAPKPVEEERVALSLAVAGSETKLPAPMERGRAKEVE